MISSIYNNKVIRSETIFGYFFALLIILNCASIIGMQPLEGKVIKFLFQFFLFAFSCKSLFDSHLGKNLSNQLLNGLVFLLSISFIYLMMLIFIEYICYHHLLSSNPTLSVIDLNLFVIYFVCNSNNIDINISIFTKFENMIIALSVISLFFWILASIGIKPNVVSNMGWGGSNLENSHNVYGYYYLDFITQGKVHLLFIHSIIRNSGIFVEAPIYSYVLCVALFVELFLKNNNKIFNYKVIILLITIFSTTSSMGIMLGLCSILLRFEYVSSNQYYKLIALLIMGIIALIIFKSLFLEKLDEQFNNGITNYDSSYFIRSDDIVSCLKAWKNHLLIGNGFGNITAIYKYMNPNRFLPNGNTGLSSGFFDILSDGGLLFGSFYILPTLLSMKYQKVRVISIICFILSMINMVSYTYIYIMILAYIWSTILFRIGNKDKEVIYN